LNLPSLAGFTYFLPSVRKLHDLGVDYHQILAFSDAVTEKVEIEKIDYKSASVRVVEELRQYRLLGGLQTQLEPAQQQLQQTQQQLSMLGLLPTQKERALTVLMELQNRGVSTKYMA
jgi:hypothetical protein